MGAQFYRETQARSLTLVLVGLLPWRSRCEFPQTPPVLYFVHVVVMEYRFTARRPGPHCAVQAPLELIVILLPQPSPHEHRDSRCVPPLLAIYKVSILFISSACDAHTWGVGFPLLLSAMVGGSVNSPWLPPPRGQPEPRLPSSTESSWPSGSLTLLS